MSPIEREETISKAQASIYQLVQFAAERARVPLTNDLIRRSVAVARVVPKDLSPADEQELWSVLNSLTTAVYPATAVSLRNLGPLEAKESDPRRAVRSASAWLIVTITLLLIVQIYVMVVRSVLGEIDRLQEAVFTVQRDKAALKRDQNHAMVDVLDGRLGDLSRRLDAQNTLLSRWHIAGRVRDLPTLPEAEVPVARASTQQGARSVLDALSIYLLPLLYGLLGAVTFVIRRLADQIDHRTFTAVARLRYRIRICLGAVFGITIGLLLDPKSQIAQSVSLSGVALPFIAGYSVEIVFALFDYWIAKIRDVLNVPEPRVVDPVSQSAPVPPLPGGAPTPG